MRHKHEWQVTENGRSHLTNHPIAKFRQCSCGKVQVRWYDFRKRKWKWANK
jgi:hypothetical protein